MGPLNAGDIAARGKGEPVRMPRCIWACLAECGLVRWERDGKFMNYELADKRVVKLLDHAEDLLLQVGPLIEACRRYQRPARRMARTPRTKRRRWRR